jgi:large subunit ribosomal protein L1
VVNRVAGKSAKEPVCNWIKSDQRKNDDTSNIHQSIGKVSFSEAQLKENLAAFLDVLKRAKPTTSKGTYLQNLIICSTMGPAIRIASEA